MKIGILLVLALAFAGVASAECLYDNSSRINISAGWNLVSVPMGCQVDSTPPLPVMPTAYAYSGGAYASPVLYTSMVPGTAYWVLSTSYDFIGLCCYNVPPTGEVRTTLNPGWNLVPLPSRVAYSYPIDIARSDYTITPCAPITITPYAGISSVYAYNSGAYGGSTGYTSNLYNPTTHTISGGARWGSDSQGAWILYSGAAASTVTLRC